MKEPKEVERIPNQLSKSISLVALLAVLALVMTTSLAKANPGDSWILPIGFLQGGGFVTIPGAGYSGSTAYEASGPDPARRVYWELSGAVGYNTANPIPLGTTLYTISLWTPTSGATDWQPIESQIRGAGGEIFPNDPLIP